MDTNASKGVHSGTILSCCFMIFSFCFMLMCFSHDSFAAGQAGSGLAITNISGGYVLPARRSVVLKVRKAPAIKKGDLVFRSSRPSVARIDKKGRITALKNGNTYITVYNKRNRKQKAGVRLYVGKRITRLKLVRPKSKASVSLTEGGAYQVKWQTAPAGAAFKRLSWTSSKPLVCRVSASGRITASKAGTAVVTAKARDGSGKKFKITVRVNAKSGSGNSTSGGSGNGQGDPADPVVLPTSVSIDSPLKYPYLKENSKITLSAEVTPYKASQEVVWSSSDPGVASVDAKGVVTAHGSGTAVIYAVASAKSSVKASYTLKVPSGKDCKATLIAHRGYSAVAPENTKAAFSLAARGDNSFDAIECDVHKTKDGKFVISHDSNLSRIFGLDREIKECNYDEIKDLVAVGGKGVRSYPKERICTLEQYMDILKKSNKRAVIELKESYRQDVSDKLYGLISSYGINNRMDIISFNYDALLQMSWSIQKSPGTAAPDLYLLSSCPDVGMVVNGNLTDAQWAVNQGFHLDAYYYWLSADVISAMHGAGKKIGVYTVDDFSTACHFIFDLGVDCMTSNTLLF